MDRNRVNIEDLFRSQFDGYTVDPTPGLWAKLRMRILWKQFFSFSLNQFNVYYLAVVLSLGVVGGIILTGDRSGSDPAVDQGTNLVQSRVREALPAPGDDQVPEQAPRETGIKSDFVPAGKDSEVKAKAAGDQENADTGPAGHAEEKDTGSGEPGENAIPAAKENMVASSIGFISSVSSGCAPLAVDFTNTSENATGFRWSFGDGGSSTEKDPSYVFDESGEYSVVLKMTGLDGPDYMHKQSIHVYEKPTALFEVDAEAGLEGPVYFYNYSKAATFYKWDFGDLTTSNLSDPVHYYEQAASYHVKLKVWNEHLCYDSLVVFNAFEGLQNEITFPNAFAPNPNGPSGGYYNGTDIGNTIFHPVVRGELVEYQLKIFNRTGVLLFESNDIHIGWDGYYRESLAPQGVYIWKSRGRFSNGETFVISGDLTLVRAY